MSLLDDRTARWREASEFSKVELLNAREEISKREQEIATRALVVTGVSGVMLTFVVDGHIGLLDLQFFAFCLIALSLLTALASLFRMNLRTKSVADLMNVFESKIEWSPTHVHNMLISENLKVRESLVNRFNFLSVVSLMFLFLGTFLFLITAAIEV